jgi:hypothetical protein
MISVDFAVAASNCTCAPFDPLVVSSLEEKRRFQTLTDHNCCPSSHADHIDLVAYTPEKVDPLSHIHSCLEVNIPDEESRWYWAATTLLELMKKKTERRIWIEEMKAAEV